MEALLAFMLLKSAFSHEFILAFVVIYEALVELTHISLLLRIVITESLHLY